MRRRWGWIALVTAGCAQAAMAPGPGDPDAGPAELEHDAGTTPTPVPVPVPLPDPPPDPAPDPAPAPYACEGRTGEPGQHVLVIPHDGLLRRVLLRVPESYDPGTGTMLVLNFHGFSSADWQQELLTRMGAAAEARGFIVAYPQGVATSWNAGDCCGTAWVDGVDDVGFVRAVLDRLERDYCIDPARVYATGMSNGGFFAHRLACELSDRIAAIAPVAGVLGMDSCNPPRPVPVFHFHGTEDLLVPYEGGTPVVHELGAGIVFRSVEETLAHWAEHNGCEGGPVTTMRDGDVTCVEWTRCEAETRLCTVDGGGHTWPGGLPVPFLGKTTTHLDATEAMLDFFDASPMRR